MSNDQVRLSRHVEVGDDAAKHQYIHQHCCNFCYCASAVCTSKADCVAETHRYDTVRDRQRFDGKKVRFFASFQSDGLEHSALINSRCGRGIIPFAPDEVEHHPDIEAFDHALDKGRRGTMDKRIVAMFTGQFVRKPNPSSHTRFFLEIKRIDHLQVTMIDLTPHVPR